METQQIEALVGRLYIRLVELTDQNQQLATILNQISDASEPPSNVVPFPSKDGEKQALDGD